MQIICLQVLKMMVGKNLNDVQLQQIVDKTIVYLDKVYFCLYNINNVLTSSYFRHTIFGCVSFCFVIFEFFCGRITRHNPSDLVFQVVRDWRV